MKELLRGEAMTGCKVMQGEEEVRGYKLGGGEMSELEKTVVQVQTQVERLETKIEAMEEPLAKMKKEA